MDITDHRSTMDYDYGSQANNIASEISNVAHDENNTRQRTPEKHTQSQRSRLPLLLRASHSTDIVCSGNTRSPHISANNRSRRPRHTMLTPLRNVSREPSPDYLREGVNVACLNTQASTNVSYQAQPCCSNQSTIPVEIRSPAHWQPASWIPPSADQHPRYSRSPFPRLLANRQWKPFVSEVFRRTLPRLSSGTTV